MQRLAQLCLARPVTAAVALALVTLALGAGLRELRTEFGSRVLIGDDHPAIQRLDAFLARYGGGVPLYIAWECGEGRPCASVLDADSLAMAHDVTTALADAPGVSQVRGPANSPIFVAGEEGFAVRTLVEDGEVVADREALAQRVESDALWIGNLVSRDRRVAAIVVQPVASDGVTDALLVEAVLAAIASHPDFDFALVGEAFGNVLGGRELAASMGTLVPFMVLVIAAVIGLQTRSWQCVLASLLTLGTALVWSFGLLGWLGWPRDSILELLAPLLLIVGICDAIHLFSVYADELGGRSSAPDRRAALERAAGRVARPCLLTTATTAAAFLSFATSDLDTFERFGVISAFGVIACLALSFSLLPLLLRALPAQGRRSAETTRSWRIVLAATVDCAERRAVPILVATLLALAVCAFAWAALLRVDTSRQELFGENSRILRWVDFFESHLRPSFGIEMDLLLPEGARLEDPSVLAQVERFAAEVSALPRVGRALSVADLLRPVHAALHGGADRRANGRGDGTLPRSAAGTAELLEILAFEDPDLLASWVSFDRRHLRLSLDVHEQNHAAAGELVRAVRGRADALLPDWEVVLTGTAPLGLDWVSEVQATQLRSFPTAFALVFVLVSLFLRSAALGLAALVPAAVPVVVVLGGMALAGLSLDVGRAMIAAVVIGIAVDDGIHLLHHYARTRRRGGPPGEAMRDALLETGRPIVVTSLALSLGFLTLTASAWGTVSGFGFFVSLSIAVALLATLFVLPALVFLVARPARRRAAAAGGLAEGERT